MGLDALGKLTFTTAEECIEALSPLILLETTTSWALLGLGAAIVVAIGVHLFMKGGTNFAYYSFVAVMAILGTSVAAIALTGQVPFVAAANATDISIKQNAIRTAISVGCYQLDEPSAEIASPSPVTDVPRTVAPAGAVGFDQLDKATFVWVFYKDGRAREAADIERRLVEAGISHLVAADNFSSVRVPGAAGDTKVLYADPAFEDQARTTAEAIKTLQPTGNVAYEGPFPTMVRKPIQVLLY